jgi:hypothetical protein
MDYTHATVRKQVVDVPVVAAGTGKVSTDPGLYMLLCASGVDVQTGGEEVAPQCAHPNCGRLFETEEYLI